MRLQVAEQLHSLRYLKTKTLATENEYKTEIQELSEILNKYPDTNILIEGHTDSTGSEEYNLTLSRQRAQSVANYLAQLEVNPTRFTIMGYGESQPISENETVDGRAQNRRVDLGIWANDKLKKAAKDKGDSIWPDLFRFLDYSRAELHRLGHYEVDVLRSVRPEGKYRRHIFLFCKE